MKRLNRPDLAATLQSDLDARQDATDLARHAGHLDVSKQWKTARPTPAMEAVCVVLRHMTGQRERCMYCLDSHGTDMEHFWPKTSYPEKMFRWPNLLLCCAECGRFKGDQFPLEAGQPMLIDPTLENPWEQLDFDPATGNIVARFDPAVNGWTQKGTATVAVLHLDRREAMASGYQKTFRRLASLVRQAVKQTSPNGDELAAALLDADDHGLLGWCFVGTGQNEPPFRELREQHPAIWATCVDACGDADVRP